jgi:inhibitor of cysteine peptidase
MLDLILTQEDTGKSFTVYSGDRIAIQLKENPTTGYRWAIDRSDNTILALQSSDFAVLPGTGIGRGGTRTFTFKAEKSGAVHLHLKQWRGWEGDSSIIGRYDVTIQVQS